MRFSTALVALLPVGAALAQTTFKIVVGGNGTLTFSPPSIDGAKDNDVLQFFFAAKNHTVTQSSFAQPCAPFTPPGATGPIQSGFQAVPQANEATGPYPVFTTTLNNVTGPLWFYCQQTVPANHCQKGMVFAVNPTADKSFAAFQQAAMNPNGTAPANGTSSAPSSGSPSASSPVASGAPSGSGSDGPVPAPVTTSAGSSDSTSPSSSASSSSTSAAPTSSANAASSVVHVGSAGMLLGGVGLLFGLVL